MAIITTGTNFNPTQAVTSTDLNNIANAATFVAGAVDGTSLELKVDGKLGIKDAGVTAAKLATDALELAYPVGSIYMNATVATNPGTLLGFGTWASFGAGQVPVGIDATDNDFDIVGSGTYSNGTTGAKTHTLDITEIPPHKHEVQIEQAKSNVDGGSGTGVRPPLEARDTSEVGGGLAHNNLQPYIVVHMWTRTA